MNEIFEIFGILMVALAVLVPLVRAVTDDGYGVRPPPARAGESRRSLTMPHDETRPAR